MHHIEMCITIRSAWWICPMVDCWPKVTGRREWRHITKQSSFGMSCLWWHRFYQINTCYKVNSVVIFQCCKWTLALIALWLPDKKVCCAKMGRTASFQRWLRLLLLLRNKFWDILWDFGLCQHATCSQQPGNTCCFYHNPNRRETFLFGFTKNIPTGVGESRLAPCCLGLSKAHSSQGIQ